MSHIRTKEELIECKKFLELLKCNQIDAKVIEQLLRKITPRDNSGRRTVGCRVGNFKTISAAYMPSSNTIVVSPNNLLENAKLSSCALAQNSGIENVDEITKYYQLFALLHEVEHAYQFKIGNEELETSNSELNQGYRNIVKTLRYKDGLIPRPIKTMRHVISSFKYYKKPYSYILERNASLEAADDIAYLAGINEKSDMQNAFNVLKDAMEYIGYEESKDGCMYKTHKELLLLDKYRKIVHDDKLSDEERLRAGLSVNEQAREKLLAKIKRNNVVL